MLRAVAGVRGLAADDPFGVELMHVLIDDTDIDDNVRRLENTVPGAWATVESCDVAELLLASLDAGVPFSCRLARRRDGVAVLVASDQSASRFPSTRACLLLDHGHGPEQLHLHQPAAATGGARRLHGLPRAVDAQHLELHGLLLPVVLVTVVFLVFQLGGADGGKAAVRACVGCCRRRRRPAHHWLAAVARMCMRCHALAAYVGAAAGGAERARLSPPLPNALVAPPPRGGGGSGALAGAIRQSWYEDLKVIFVSAQRTDDAAREEAAASSRWLRRTRSSMKIIQSFQDVPEDYDHWAPGSRRLQNRLYQRHRAAVPPATPPHGVAESRDYRACCYAPPPAAPRTAPPPATVITASRRQPRRRPRPRREAPAAEPPTPTYTRDVVRRVDAILRGHPWSAARPLLLSLPGLAWDSHTVARVLKAHPPLHKAFLFFRLAAGAGGGFRHDRFTYTSMLHLLGEAGRVPAMMRLLAEMLRAGVDPDAATFTTVMHWLAHAGDVDAAMRVWEEMRARKGKCRPTLVSYTACVKILFDAGRPAEAREVFQEMVAEGLRPSCKTYTVLIEHLANVGKFEATMEIMDKMQEAGVEPDKALCNILVQKCSRAGETSVMTRILQYMKENFIVLRRPIFLEALEALKANDKNVVTYTALMSAYFQDGKVDKALQLFLQMSANGVSACPAESFQHLLLPEHDDIDTQDCCPKDGNI
uniref:Membrane-associated salt-inducible protein n=1 Tax=Oryza sativa subsp. japonica TaxID=39947 RepID=Q8W2V6_ORYSJ|nr:putative membrane-associated salt-inducible protein [Oryza sativa Japonica Group]